MCPLWQPGDAQGPAGRRPGSWEMSPGFRHEVQVLTLMPAPGRGAQEARVWTECWERAFTKKHESEVQGWVPRRPGLTVPMTP